MLFRCILDGEMLVWDMAAQHFAEFGSNQEIGLSIASCSYCTLLHVSFCLLAFLLIPFLLQQRQQRKDWRAIARLRNEDCVFYSICPLCSILCQLISLILHAVVLYPLFFWIPEVGSIFDDWKFYTGEKCSF